MIEINGMKFKPLEGVKYKHDYERITRDAKAGKFSATGNVEESEKNAYGTLILSDLWFIVYFVYKIPIANHKFWVNACREVEEGPPTNTLDLWGREHGKTSIITRGESLQKVLRDPERRIGIFSHTRPAAKDILRGIKLLLETSDFLKWIFKNILWEKPEVQSPKWALDINTPVLTTKGWKKHGDLTRGDKIYGAKGQIITVLGNSGQMDNVKCCRVVFDDSTFIASAEHLWPTQCKSNNSIPWNKGVIKILRTFELKPKTKKMRMLATPIINNPAKGKLPVDPYILGLWLGDGTIGTNIISMHREDEPELLKQFSKIGYEYYIHRRKEKDNFSMYGLRGLKEDLGKAGCLSRKHLPENYLFGDKEVRLALLQGFMDSDGTCKKDSKHRAKGMCMFSNTNTNLADSVFFLAASLGLKPHRYSFMPKSRGRKMVNHIYFVGIKQMPPFRLSRKLNNCKEKRYMDGRYIKFIEEIPATEVNCIKVDSEDNLYLAGKSLVPTHNSEDEGLILKRKGYYRESTFEAWGLLEAMPQGKHFTDRYNDDIETDDIAENPDTIIKLRRKFELAKNLGTDGGTERTTGTYFTHDGVLTYIETAKGVDGKSKYYVRKKPSTEDGTRTGKPVFLSQERLNDLMADDYIFNCQHLLNPTPKASRTLNFDLIKFIEPKEIPPEAYRFIVIDSAGDKTTQKRGDAWGIHTIGVEPKRDQIGASNIYILDMFIDELSESMAIEQIARMYLAGGMIMQIGYERLMNTTPGWIVHLKNLLLSKGRLISEEAGSLVSLQHRGRHKEHRIHSALEWPLNNGKIHISTAVNKKYVDRLRHEIEKFPFWHDDGLDALSYFYDLIKDYNFPDEYDTEPIKQIAVGVV